MPRHYISLYQCHNAKCGKDGIYCDKGHDLEPWNRYGGNKFIALDRLERGEPLEIAACRYCTELDWDTPVMAKDRGWLNKEAI